MTNSRQLRKALITSLISLLLCFSMLVGTTFAWFTDTVSSKNNIIVAGNLDVGLEYKNSVTDDWTEVTGTSNVFLENTLWEPGHVEVIKFKVSNLGSLALKYQFNVNIVDETGSINVFGDNFKLSSYIYYGVIAGEFEGTREQAVAAVEGQSKLISEGTTKANTIEANANAQYLTMVVYMPSSADNVVNYVGSANKPEIILGIDLIATQLSSESDSFDNQYDNDANYPIISAVVVPENAGPVAVAAGEVTVTIPVGAEKGTYNLEVSNVIEQENSVSLNIDLVKDGEKVSGLDYEVEIQLDAMKTIERVTHNGEDITYNYNAVTGVLSFITQSFSPFKIEFKSIAVEDVEIDENNKIVSGVFEEVNPATLDESLLGADSEYIAINYKKDGKTCYVVSERATTKVVSADDASGYVAENGNYQVEKNYSGQLYKIFQAVDALEHSTVYLLPGTYTEATTVTVSSSTDIIGLGDKDSVKVIKKAVHTTKDKVSNQHLFNCTNYVKAEYIHVTLSNLYLESTELNTYIKNGRTQSADNALVQSIRKSKVKCYDLTLVKSVTDSMQCALYVNGKNAHSDGTTYTAYLYAENCNLIICGAGQVVSTLGTYKFYHSGLTLDTDTAYTKNSGSILNKVMAKDDWNW